MTSVTGPEQPQKLQLGVGTMEPLTGLWSCIPAAGFTHFEVEEYAITNHEQFLLKKQFCKITQPHP